MSYRTEPPFTGAYVNTFEKGIYICRACRAPLYTSESKFHSGCGWPSFDDEIPSAVTKVQDPDGRRIEILCSKCHAHLGHVFYGELCTSTNTRHCVNSYALQFLPALEIAVFGTGCFWCSEALFSRIKGVVRVSPGYAGGTVKNPTYEMVSSGKTGHAEVVQIEFDPTIVSFETLLDIFWTIHDPTSLNRQGHDVGTQYRSIILYTNPEQKKKAEASLKAQQQSTLYAHPIVTEIQPLGSFYKAERYHLEYYDSHPNESYCKIVIDPKIAHLTSQFESLVR